MCEKYVFAGIKRKSILFSIKSLILLIALAAILVLLTAITVSATVYSPWTREAVDTTSTTDIQCAKVGDANYTQEQEFTWGVLAINTHKSIYLPNEAASIGIAVLDNEGHMVCDADVTLTITDPGNNETVLSTGNGLIKVSPQCCVYGVTNLPDFYTNYTVDGAGTYVMNLTVTAVTADGTKSITDEFTVQNSVDFDVARDGPTRIYPPVSYVMNFTIKANKNYTGLIREYVPASFVITLQDGLTVTTVGDTKILTWTKNLVEGETYNFYYAFDAPDVSPYLFTLGALEIGSFKEDRQWQIANDGTETYYFDDHDGSVQEWKECPACMADGSTTTYAVCKVNGRTELLNRTNCLGTDLGPITIVKIRAYGYITLTTDYVELRPEFNAGVGTYVTADLPLDSGDWGTPIDITTDTNYPVPWTWSNVSNLECGAICRHPQGQTTDVFVAKVEIEVNHTPTWVSYSDLDCLTQCDNFSSYADQHIVYMRGSGFRPSTAYKIIFWDSDGANVEAELNSSDEYGVLNAAHRFASGDKASPPSWNATVYYPEGYNPISHDSDDAYLLADASFTVQDSAIPEFPGVVTAIAVCMLCAVAYMVMRRKVGKR